MKNALVVLISLMSFSALAHADCDLPEGFQVTARLLGPKSSIDYQLQSGFYQAAIADYDDQCVSDRCIQIQDALDDAYYAHSFLKITVDDTICNDMDQYMLGVSMGGSFDSIMIPHIQSVRVDRDFPGF